MEKQPLLSIAIPTYNRAGFLQILFDNIVPQIIAADDAIQICISNNASTDNTRPVIANVEEKHPGLIKYHQQERNFGAHVNFLKVMDMSDGQFVWLLGDDDLVVESGIKKLIDS